MTLFLGKINDVMRCRESITAFGPGDENRFLLVLTWRSFLVPLHGSLATAWCGAT